MNAPNAPTYLRYTLTLRAPVIASTLSGDPNSAATQPFIPGSAIRGAVAARLLAPGANGDSAKFRDLVLSGAVRYLHAYPTIDGARGLPTPASWRRHKDEPETVCDLATYSGDIPKGLDPEDFGKFWPEEALTGVGEPFVAAGGSRSAHRPRIDARLHQQRDRVKGRPWKEVEDGAEVTYGAIFAYEYLEADQSFSGVIQVMPSATVPSADIKALFAAPILIGRSRRAGYGGEGAITFAADAASEYGNVTGAVSRQVETGTRFRVLLTSAYIGRHPSTGQIDPLALDHELDTRLSGSVRIERRYWSLESVGGFNQKWRLALPQTHAVAAGAVLVLEATRPLSLDALRQIEHEGLGERRAEGFGRLLFLTHAEDTTAFDLKPYDWKRAETQDTGAAPVTVQGQAQDEVQGQLAFLESRIVLTAAEAELERVTADLVGSVNTGNIPTNSLLGRLRTVLRGARDNEGAEDGLQTLSAWCGDGDLALKKPARDQLDNCYVGNKTLRQWLQELATPRAGTTRWQALVQASGNASTLTALAQNHHLRSVDDAQTVLDDHTALLSVHLADGLLAALARSNRGGAR